MDRTESTNLDAAAIARAQPADDRRAFVVAADAQTAGRGRRDRSWDMQPGGGLLVSFALPWTDRDTVHLVPMAVGVAIVSQLDSIEVDAGLKWPNDVIASRPVNDASAVDRAGGGKLAGMLSELVVDPSGALRSVVVGVGLNVTWPTPADVASGDDRLAGATCLAALDASTLDRAEILAGIKTLLDDELDRLETLGPGVALDRYRARCTTIGSRVRIEQTNTHATGTATDVDRSGRLVVRTDPDGVLRTYDVGDVVHLRAG